MIKRPSQRVAIFIDAQNMYHSAKHMFGSRVNFPAVVEAATANRELIRAIAYVAKSKTGEESAFFDALVSHDIELKVKDVQEFSSGAKKADWDVGMCVDAISILPKVDVIILVTGDGDFCPLVEYVKNHGALCEVVSFANSTNAHLKEMASHLTDLAEDPEQFLLGYRSTDSKKPRRKSSEDQDPAPPKHEKPSPKRRSSKASDDSSLDLPTRNIRITY